MLTFIVIALVVVVVAVVFVARRNREPRPESFEGHRTDRADHHWSGGSHSGEGYGGGGGDAGRP